MDAVFYASGLVCHICGRSRNWCLDLDIYAEAQRFVVSKAKESHSFADVGSLGKEYDDLLAFPQGGTR